MRDVIIESRAEVYSDYGLRVLVTKHTLSFNLYKILECRLSFQSVGCV